MTHRRHLNRAGRGLRIAASYQHSVKTDLSGLQHYPIDSPKRGAEQPDGPLRIDVGVPPLDAGGRLGNTPRLQSLEIAVGGPLAGRLHASEELPEPGTGASFASLSSAQFPSRSGASMQICRNSSIHRARTAAVLFLLVMAAPAGFPANAQPVRLTPSQLDQLVSRIALYPDPLLAQILAASTYQEQIPEAAAWAREHSYLTGEALAEAIRSDNLRWDPSVIALLPFPSVLEMMARDPAWVQQLGGAALSQREEVMDAVQRMRRKAMDLGYLQSTSYATVNVNQGYIEILPPAPGVIYVPAYDPLVVFSRPVRGLAIGGAIRFGPGITIGAAFAPWGWTRPLMVWPNHTIIIDRPWERRWAGREHYVHPFFHPWVHGPGPRVEHHHIHKH